MQRVDRESNGERRKVTNGIRRETIELMLAGDNGTDHLRCRNSRCCLRAARRNATNANAIITLNKFEP